MKNDSIFTSATMPIFKPRPTSTSKQRETHKQEDMSPTPFASVASSSTALIPSTIYCIHASSPPLSNEATCYSAYDFPRASGDSLPEEVSSEDLEKLKNIVKEIRQNPTLLSQAFPTIDKPHSNHHYHLKTGD